MIGGRLYSHSLIHCFSRDASDRILTHHCLIDQTSALTTFELRHRPPSTALGDASGMILPEAWQSRGFDRQAARKIITFESCYCLGYSD